MFDKFQFPMPFPFLNLFFASYCRFHDVMRLIPDEPVNLVFLSETINGIILMLPNALC